MMDEDSKKPEFTSLADLGHEVERAHWRMLEAMFLLRWDVAKAACSRKKRLDTLTITHVDGYPVADQEEAWGALREVAERLSGDGG
jgi:hypothetical protein